MAGRVQHYRSELKKRRGEWESYLKANSGLPGARANLELVEAVGEEADADLLWRLSASSDEFLALCGTAGLGRLVATDPSVLPWLKELAEDPRWRVREGVVIALQRFGRADMPALIAEMEAWSKAGPLVQRAAAAAVCEPPLLKKPDEVKRVLQILDHITRSMAATRAGDGLLLERRRGGQPRGGQAAAREVAALVRSRHRVGHEKQSQQGAHEHHAEVIGGGHCSESETRLETNQPTTTQDAEVLAVHKQAT